MFTISDDILNHFKGQQLVEIHKFGENTHYKDLCVVFLGTDNRKIRNFALSIEGEILWALSISN